MLKLPTLISFECAAKKKRVRQQYGFTAEWKKAIVTLKQGIR
jgi:ribosomal protein L23